MNILTVRETFKLAHRDIDLPAQLTEDIGYHSACYGRFTALANKYKKKIDDVSVSITGPSTRSPTPPIQFEARYLIT